MTNQYHVIIIGAGIGGLTLSIALRKAGHDVTILEQAKKLSEVGAGIQLAPNATRILKDLDILPAVSKCASKPSGLIVRRYADDSEIGPRSHSGTQSRFDSPMFVIHRADLQRILVAEALNLGVALRTDARAQSIDHDFAAAVTLSSGEIIRGHVLVGADGINSLVRKEMANFGGYADTYIPTGDLAYRVIIPRAELVNAPQVLLSSDQGMSTRWLGPGGHIMAYPLRDGQLYNVVMIRASSDIDINDSANLWSRRGDMKDLSSFYGSWGNMVQRFVDRIDSATLMQWPLYQRPTLPRWHANCTALLGDACHPMLPYVAQGAAQAIEDAAALATCLTLVDDVPRALSIYEELRKPRAEFIQSCAEDMRRVLHFADGPEQERRDRTMRAERGPGWKHPDLWADPAFQDQVWGYNVVDVARVKCETLGKPEPRHNASAPLMSARTLLTV